VKKHCVYFKGRVEFSSESEDEDEILDEAYELITSPDANVTIVNMEIDDEEEAESEENK
jgi:hypothetical protein